MLNIQDENVLISWAFLAKSLEKFWRKKFKISLENLVVIFLLTVRNKACDRVGRTFQIVIGKFSRRKECQHVWSVKKDLKKLTMEDLKLPENSKLFINRSLCPYYKMLWSKSKKLHSLSKYIVFFISGDTIKIRVKENSSSLSITHVDDFSKHFPDVNLSPPSRTS